MNEQDIVRQITSLQAGMNRMEALMQQLLLTMTSSGAHVEQTAQMQNMLQELRSGGSDGYAGASYAQPFGQQERPDRHYSSSRPSFCER
ncbi:MAG TPA: hypothetical protein VGD98_06175 [Ktedonobacteraceae bacterium]